jgi:hypothetical protein
MHTSGKIGVTIDKRLLGDPFRSEPKYAAVVYSVGGRAPAEVIVHEHARLLINA